MTLVQHGKKAKSNPDLKLEDLCLTFSIEAMTHWVSSASFLHVKIFLKGLFQEWKGSTTNLSFVSLVKCHSLRRSSCRDHAPSNICNHIAAVSQTFNRSISTIGCQSPLIPSIKLILLSSSWSLRKLLLTAVEGSLLWGPLMKSLHQMIQYYWIGSFLVANSICQELILVYIYRT